MKVTRTAGGSMLPDPRLRGQQLFGVDMWLELDPERQPLDTGVIPLRHYPPDPAYDAPPAPPQEQYDNDFSVFQK